MNWAKTSHRFIGFFDIMGFKDQVARNTHEVMLKKMESLASILKPVDKRARKLMDGIQNDSEKNASKSKGDDLYKSPKPVIFSDSIILISHSDTKKDLFGMIASACWLLSECFDEQIPIKGAISYGEFTADIENSLYFGQPLIDSYLLHEELAYYGCIFDDKVEAKYQELNFTENENLFLYNWKSILKCGKINHLNVNWPFFYNLTNEVSPIKTIEKFYKTVSGKPRQYVDNTLDFIKSIEPYPSFS